MFSSITTTLVIFHGDYCNCLPNRSPHISLPFYPQATQESKRSSNNPNLIASLFNVFFFILSIKFKNPFYGFFQNVVPDGLCDFAISTPESCQPSLPSSGFWGMSMFSYYTAPIHEFPWPGTVFSKPTSLPSLAPHTVGVGEILHHSPT